MKPSAPVMKTRFGIAGGVAGSGTTRNIAQPWTQAQLPPNGDRAPTRGALI